MNPSDLFKLNSNDFIRGATTAVFAGVVFALGGLAATPNFDVLSADWGAILHMAVNAGAAALIGYIGKQFVSDKNGAVFGVFAGHK